MLTIRPETPQDYAAVRAVNERAFEGPAEADLVDRLRHAVERYLSLLAEDEGHVVGHIFFSPVEVEPAATPFPLMGLAPMAVLPECQRQGVGSALVHEGLQACREVGGEAVVVLGHPGYYPRFGFKPAESYGLHCEYDVPAEVFMASELTPGAFDGLRGLVKYHAAFNGLE